MLLTIPGLTLFYGDFVKKETVLNTFLSFSAYAFVSIIWLSYNTCGEVVQIRTGKRDLDAI